MNATLWKYRIWAVACGLGLLLGGCSAGEQQEYTTAYPDVGSVVSTVENTGTVTYRDSYSIVPSVSGRVLSCLFEEGDTVSAGQTLYVIDSSDLEDQIAQARLSLSSAQAAYAQAVAACGDLTVLSYATGTVTQVNVHVGDYVTTGTAIAQVVDSANLTLTVPFSTEDAALISSGSAAVITFLNQAGTLTGTVARVYDTSTVLSGGRAGVYVEISFQNPGAVSSGTIAQATVNGVACMESGTVSYATEQSIYATQSGQVLTLPIQAGSSVTAGQVVMTLENASLTNAVTNASLSVDSAQVSLAQLESKLPDYTIYAPVDGTILTRSVKEGDLASAGTPMATLAQPEALCVHVDIDELYIDQVQPGQTADISFTTDSGETRTYTGTVNRVDDTGVTSGGVTDYTVEILLDSADGLRSGMNVEVSICCAAREDCLRVPSGAVSGGTVQVLRDGKAETVTVETGLTGGGYTEILSGLSESDEIILP